MKYSLPSTIRHNQSGFATLMRFYAQTKAALLDDIEVDFKAVTWFDADMCAVLGAMLYGLGKRVNTIRLTHIQQNVEAVLSKNGFLSNYGREKIPDTWGTTIPYQRFEVKDDRYFAAYIESEIMQRSELPGMSPGLKKKFRESIFEIFSNAVLHSRTELGIFSCGQFFPAKHRLDFMVADLGIGIRQNVKDNTGLDLTAEKAIEWATEGHNTTKRGPIPGGLGLKLLGEFIELNRGQIQIVSDAGYWCRNDAKISIYQLEHAFPGTVVSLEINTADTRSYALSSELSAENIF